MGFIWITNDMFLDTKLENFYIIMPFLSGFCVPLHGLSVSYKETDSFAKQKLLTIL